MANRLLISHWPTGYHYTVGVAIVHIAPVKATLDDHAISGFRVLLFLSTRGDLNIIFPSRVPSITNRTTFIAYQPKSSSDESKNDQADTPPQQLHYLWTDWLYFVRIDSTIFTLSVYLLVVSHKWQDRAQDRKWMSDWHDHNSTRAACKILWNIYKRTKPIFYVQLDPKEPNYGMMIIDTHLQ